MKYIVILMISMLLFACASTEERREAKIQKEQLERKIENVKFSSDDNVKECIKLRYLSCSTRRPDGEKVCREWFKVHAAEADGNVVVLKNVDVTYDKVSTQYGDVTRVFTRIPGQVYKCETQ